MLQPPAEKHAPAGRGATSPGRGPLLPCGGGQLLIGSDTGPVPVACGPPGVSNSVPLAASPRPRLPRGDAHGICCAYRHQQETRVATRRRSSRAGSPDGANPPGAMARSSGRTRGAAGEKTNPKCQGKRTHSEPRGEPGAQLEGEKKKTQAQICSGRSRTRNLRAATGLGLSTAASGSWRPGEALQVPAGRQSVRPGTGQGRQGRPRDGGGLGLSGAGEARARRAGRAWERRRGEEGYLYI